MRPAARDRAVPAGLALGSLVLALVQRPGQMVMDTKVDLHLDPGGFLSEVASAWTSTADLGHVWAGQYGGYLFPMAPWFAAGHALGLPDWLVHRLWLGVLLALAAWGVVRLLDALAGRPRGAVHIAAAVLYVVNPYVTVYADRTSVSLLAYAALPWMLLLVHRGLREPQSWAWPAAFALVLTSTGGGVNAAVTAWVLLGPLLFAVYERCFGGVGRGAVWPFAWRFGVTNALASAWWVVPLLVHTRYGLGFLPFTEQPGTIWSTTSVTESLRLMGFWTSYIGTGFGGHLVPFATQGHALLFDPPVVVASLLVPGLALAGFAWTRRWRYGPWFLLLTLAGLLVMVAGWPEGTPLRKGLTFTYNHVSSVQFLRTSYKAGALVALGLAGLGGAAFGAAWGRWRGLGTRVVVSGVAVALVGAAAWPLVSGRALESQLAVKHGVPAAWRQAAADLDRRGDTTRALSVPGQLFSFYSWGGTIDHVLTGLAQRPVATRYIVPFADLRAVDLQWAVDDLLSQERAVPGQLPPLLSLLGVGDVVLGADGDRSRSGETSAAQVADMLAAQELLGGGCGDAPGRTCAFESGGPSSSQAAGGASGRAAARPRAGAAALGGRSYGAPLAVDRDPSRLSGIAQLPRVVDIRTATPGLLRLLPRGPETIVDGGAQGIVGLAGFGALPPDRPVAYAADLGAAGIRAAARSGADLVVSDSNRRQAFVSARLKGNRGPVLPAGEDVSEDGVILDPFPAAGTAGQTVSVLRGVRSLSAPASPQVTQFPEHRAAAAMDGDVGTAWLADRFLADDRHVLHVVFTAPRDVPYVDLYPYSDSRAVVRSVIVAGRSFPVHRGWNRLRLGLRGVAGLDVAIGDLRRSVHRSAGAGGIRELRAPGVQVSERLRPPILVSDALRGLSLDRSSLTYLFDRFTGDAPSWRSPVGGALGGGLMRDQGDPERQLSRTFSLPAPRSFAVDAWIRPAAEADDAALDRLAGARGAIATSSGRFENAPRYRASSAGDGDRSTAWVAPWVGRGAWIAWRTDRPQALRSLRLVPMAARVRRPTRVRITVDGRSTAPLPVAPDGTVRLPLGGDVGKGTLVSSAAAGGSSSARAGRVVSSSAGAGGSSSAAAGSSSSAGAAGGSSAGARSGGVASSSAVGALLRGRDVRIDILAARFPSGTPARERQRRAVGVAEIEGAPRMVVPRVGSIRARCVTLAVLDGQPIRLRPAGTLADLNANAPLRARGCGRLRVAAGDHDLAGVPSTFVIDHLRLRSAATTGPLTAETKVDHPRGGRTLDSAPGTVLDPGRAGHGSWQGVRVRVDRPAWLVLGEGYSTGWRATCDGKDLGAPRPLEGYANAWPVTKGCTSVAFRFAPNRLLKVSYAISLLACLAMLAALAFFARRRKAAARGGEPEGGAVAAGAVLAGGTALRPATNPDPDARPHLADENRPDASRGVGPLADENPSQAPQILPPFADSGPPARWPLHRAVAAGVAVALVAGFVFALRAGVVAGPLVALVLWRGVPSRVLLAAAAVALVVVVPLLYLAFPGTDHGGYSTSFASEHLGAHWVAVGALISLAIVLVRTLSTASASRGGPARAPAAPAGRRSAS